MEFCTKVLHGKSAGRFQNGATLPPISQVCAFSYENAEELQKVFEGRAPGFAYTRIANPTVDAFERRICELEGGAAATACASGMAAISSTLFNILREGDEIVASAGLFGGTVDLFRDLEEYGIATKFVTRMTATEIEKNLTDKTKVIFGEIIGNPGLDVMDISAVSALAHANGIPLIVDATTATPYLIRSIGYGADIVIHSSSKYINGNGNSISGIIIDSGKFKWDLEKFPVFAEYKKFGSLAFTARLKNDAWRNIGGCLSPLNAYLNLLGVETLALRMERICENALALARELEKFDGITVNYPGLKNNPNYPLVQKQFGGRGGGIVTLRAGSRERAYKLMNSLKYALNATNIGDTKTLVIHPASTIYLHNTEEQKINAGVYDDTIRVSVGIEDAKDLIEDFCEALQKL
ncbi:MAG: aminotransferase class I/II-fold pyridoxal phosphate-dependent enzyme [Bacteroides sp.]|nr:aminotransferase class I/II-fold pyridoxal phosphate-dependent enzyme [Eubacterium sp.]MCM1418206.1 aminotransferase class I/II-fold pyridoxal phosphate-dependent enzyme [Roseburia sp.]MCM1462757.1 aminotransferase class I/II-fold pyridoxal phosphate-dependent enzyme [Bacteroides sp.]